MLNGHSQNSAWPDSHQLNENMFRLPRPLKQGDIIEINGTLQNTPQRLTLKLTTGVQSPDEMNVVCKAEADFTQDLFHINGKVNGLEDNESPISQPNLLGIFPAGGKFRFVLKTRYYEDTSIMDIFVFHVHIGTRELKHNLESVTFLTLDGDISKVEDLKFKYV